MYQDTPNISSQEKSLMPLQVKININQYSSSFRPFYFTKMFCSRERTIKFQNLLSKKCIIILVIKCHETLYTPYLQSHTFAATTTKNKAMVIKSVKTYEIMSLQMQYPINQLLQFVLLPWR
jgi:hypothetical protein